MILTSCPPARLAIGACKHEPDKILLDSNCRLEYDRGNGPRSPREVTCRDREARDVVGTGLVGCSATIAIHCALLCCIERIDVVV